MNMQAYCGLDCSTCPAYTLTFVKDEDKLRQETLSKIMKDPEKWNTLLKWGLDFSREPGAIDGGTHMIVVLRKQT